MNINAEALTLYLSRRLAIADGRNQQQAMMQTARIIRQQTKRKDTYEALGIFLTATPEGWEKIVALSEKMLIGE